MAVDVMSNKSLVRISEDGMKAYLCLCPPEDGSEYTVNDLAEILARYNVVYGVSHEKLAKILEEKDYITEHEVAQGIMPEQGQDGRYQFYFQTNVDKTPVILPDGSVDYSSMKNLEVVEEGAEIVRYIPAYAGKDGISVMGQQTPAVRGKELFPLKGKGFHTSEDKRIYYADFTGKVEYDEKSKILKVTNTLTIEGDVNTLTGDINFGGDVLIKGNVIFGMSIQAKGNIFVDGSVEGANLAAGKDVVLKNGMQGTGNGEIRAGRNVSGKFFEHTTIIAAGDVEANAIMNCHILSEGYIKVSGRRGVIVGGSVSSVRGIEASIIGNMSEAVTIINLGVDQETYRKKSELEKKIQTITEDINKLETARSQINRILGQTARPDLSERKLKLMRLKISKDSELKAYDEEVKKYQTLIHNSFGARLVVNKSIYRGVAITINGVTQRVHSENYNVTYCKDGAEITFIPNI